MSCVAEKVRTFLKSEDGPTATEYAVLIAVICIAAIATLSTFGERVENIYVSIETAVSSL
jgi:pilus assembly protein Flp/PilA